MSETTGNDGSTTGERASSRVSDTQSGFRAYDREAIATLATDPPTRSTSRTSGTVTSVPSWQWTPPRARSRGATGSIAIDISGAAR